jgi:hypothetical protein
MTLNERCDDIVAEIDRALDNERSAMVLSRRELEARVHVAYEAAWAAEDALEAALRPVTNRPAFTVDHELAGGLTVDQFGSCVLDPGAADPRRARRPADAARRRAVGRAVLQRASRRRTQARGVQRAARHVRHRAAPRRGQEGPVLGRHRRGVLQHRGNVR